MDTRKAHPVPYNELCHHLWDSLAPSVHTILCNSVGPRQFCALPSECLALWQRQQLNVSICTASSVVDAGCPGHYLSTSALPLLKAMHRICLFSWYYTYSIHLHQLAVDFDWCNTHHTQKSKHTSYFKVCHGSGRPSIFNLTYLWYPLTAVQWHNERVPITCLNLQSHGTISCQTFCYLIFWNFLLFLSEVENSKYGTRNASTTGMNKDMLLILNNNHAIGITDEVREITWFYKQRLKRMHFVKPVIL